MIYIKKCDYSGLVPGERKKAETKNGRNLLSYALKKDFGIDFDEASVVKNKYGKPYLSDNVKAHFNISHSGSYVAVMTADTEIGIDIQIVRPVRERVVEKICNKSERALVYSGDGSDRCFIQLWTLKESYIKAIGRGMSFPMNEVNFSFEELPCDTYGRLSNQKGIYFTKNYKDFVVSACVLDENANDERLSEIFKTEAEIL